MAVTAPDRNDLARSLFALLAVLGYCALSHWAVRSGHPGLAAGLALAVCFAVAASLRSTVVFAVLAALVAGWALVAIRRYGGDFAAIGASFIYLPSLAALFTLAMFLGRSLVPGQVPLFTMLATHIRGELTPRARRYTRGVTWLWTLTAALLALECMLLAAFASMHTWSLFANGINYLLVAGVFVGEYCFRRYWLSELHHPGFAQFLRRLRSADVRSALQRR